MLETLWIDIRHSLRRLRRSPAFSLVVIATLALAIGANTTVFTLVNATLLRAVSAADPHRLVDISSTDTRTGQRGLFPIETFSAFRAQQRSFSTLSMQYAAAFRIETRGAAFDAVSEAVTPEYFHLVGARLAAGRFLIDGDNDPAGTSAPAVVITDRFWRRIFNAESRAIGETMKVEGTAMRIVGVTAPGFEGLQLDAGADLFIPISLFRTLLGDPKAPIRAPHIVGRLAQGVTLEEARAEVLARWPGVQKATLGSLSPAQQSAVEAQRVKVESLETGFSGLRTQYGTSLVVVIGLTVSLLAICCVNLTGLTLARALARHQEIAVCLALGAGRARLFQQLLVDGLLLAMCGLAVALPLAWWSGQTLMAVLSRGGTIQVPTLTPDSRVLAVATVVTIIIGLLIGLLPAWRAVNARADDAMRWGRTVARTLGRSGRLVLVTQVALSMVLLVGAGLFAGMLSSLHANDVQFRGREIVWTRLARNPGDRGMLGQPFFHGLFQQLSAIPGVDSAAFSIYFPAYLGYRGATPTDRFAADAASDASPVAGLTEFISPGFFSTFGIAHLRGRDFTWQDDGRGPAVTIVSESLAGRLFPDGDAIGRRMRLTSGSMSTDLEIVGVVADAPIFSYREPHLAVAFRPMMQDLPRAQFPMAHVRVNGDVKAVRDAYIRVVESQGHHYVRALFTLDEWFDFALLQERLIAGVSSAAATLAMLLACIGIYGVLAYAVTPRVREIGVRMALGATRTTVLQMIVRDGLTVVVPGVLIGIPCALGAATLVRSQLYGVTPTDPPTIIGSAILFIVTGVVAALAPALRASKIDPVDALRQD